MPVAFVPSDFLVFRNQKGSLLTYSGLHPERRNFMHLKGLAGDMLIWVFQHPNCMHILLPPLGWLFPGRLELT